MPLVEFVFDFKLNVRDLAALGQHVGVKKRIPQQGGDIAHRRNLGGGVTKKDVGVRADKCEVAV